MAAPTSVRVWAIASTSVVLKWSYSGTADVGIYRSTDGAAYSLFDSVAANILTYVAVGLTPGTKYWFKLSDDDGATFSSVVTVKSHACVEDATKRRKGFALPRAKRLGGNDKEIPIGRRDGNKEVPIGRRNFDKAMRDIEDVVEKRILHAEPCVACVTDNAIIIDCSKDCECWDVDVDADINSITLLNCEGIDPCINFRVPPGATRGICGFPQGHGGFFDFTGDECTNNPINGGTDGRTVTTGNKPPRSKPGSGNQSGGKGGSGCECIPGSKGQLTVKCCSADCSMSCSSTKKLQIKICGGSGPYSITGSAGLTFTKQGGATVTTGITSGQTVIIEPPANSSPATPGVAYVRWLYQCTACLSGTCNTIDTPLHQDFLCSDTQSGACFTAADGHTHCSPTPPGVTSMKCHSSAGECLPQCGSCNGGYGNRVPVVCDDRTAGMIAAGCNPCGVSTNGKTFTVTDAQGVSVVTTLSV